MGKEKNTTTLFVLLLIFLVIISGLALIGVNLNSSISIVSTNNNNNNNQNNQIVKPKETQQIIVLNKETAENSNRILVDNKYVGKLEKNGNIVVMDNDGTMYSVRKGAVLVPGIVVNAQDDSYSVYRINSPEKSISTN